MFNLTNRDYPEDFVEENGNYQNKCVPCGELFCGNKHRRVCKKCATEQDLQWAKLTQEEQFELAKENHKKVMNWIDKQTGRE